MQQDSKSKKQGGKNMKHINKDRLINTFCELARIPSPFGQEKTIAQVLVKKLGELNFSVQRDSYGNIIGKLPGKGKPIVLCTHMDTVAVGKEKINVVINEEKGIISSDGTTILGADNKDSIAAILEAIAIIQERNLEHRALEIVFTREEEIISEGAKNLDFSLISGEECVISDQAAEYGTITLSAPFNYKFNVNIFGKTCHSKEPEKGVDVLKILSRAIEKNKMPLGRIDEQATSNIAYQISGLSGKLENGDITIQSLSKQGRNSIPDMGMIFGEVRSLNRESLEKTLNEIKDSLESSAEYFGGRIEFVIEKLADGYVHNQSDLLIKEIIEIFSQQGIQPKFFHSVGGSDANFLIEKGLKTVVISSAHRNNHQTSEYLIIDELFKLSEFFLLYLIK